MDEEMMREVQAAWSTRPQGLQMGALHPLLKRLDAEAAAVIDEESGPAVIAVCGERLVRLRLEGERAKLVSERIPPEARIEMRCGDRVEELVEYGVSWRWWRTRRWLMKEITM